MVSAKLFLALVAIAPGADMDKEERELQTSVFSGLWNEDFEWKLERLPLKGGVPEDRIPYSGHIYLDKNGGTARVMSKYDEAVNKDFNYPATAWENRDTSQAYSTGYRTVYSGFGPFRSARRVQISGVNAWYGHCNGWASASVRHAEPQFTVKAYGAEFTPSDIKGMLAEMYMYNDHTILAGMESYLNPGSLHAILANWLGRGSHAINMDADPSKEKWNYPIYSFSSTVGQRSQREVEVRTTIGYVKDSVDREFDKSPKLRKTKSFHYGLELNGRGEIVGGYYYNDSDRIDFVWVPLKPKRSGEPGNEQGNPHLDVDKVLAIWRQSVPVHQRRMWMIVDPADKDRSLVVPDPSRMLPRRIRIVPPPIPLEAIVTSQDVQGSSGGD
jgi:hypothetical protein